MAKGVKRVFNFIPPDNQKIADKSDLYVAMPETVEEAVQTAYLFEVTGNESSTKIIVMKNGLERESTLEYLSTFIKDLRKGFSKVEFRKNRWKVKKKKLKYGTFIIWRTQY
jgi:hypothetical protein